MSFASATHLSDAIEHIETRDELDHLLADTPPNRLVVIFFYEENSDHPFNEDESQQDPTEMSPCECVAPFYATVISEKFGEEATLVEIDIQEIPTIAQELEVTTVPTFVLLKGDAEVARMVGIEYTAAQLENIIAFWV